MSESNQPKSNDKPAAATTVRLPSTSEEPGRGASPTQTSPEPLRDVLNKLLQNADKLGEPDKQLALTIRNLATTAKDPLQFNDTTVQRQIASAALEFEKTTGKQLEFSPAGRAQLAKLTEPAVVPGDTTAMGKPADAAKPAAVNQSAPDPIRDVLTKLVASVDQIPDTAKTLGNKIRELENDAQEPLRFNQRSVQHEVSYAVQDFEKVTGKQLDLSSVERAEVTKLAGSAPGLENERMLGLLRGTAQVGDATIVREIRRSALEIGRQSNQGTPETQSRIDMLESRVRTASKPTEIAGDAAQKAEQTGPSQTKDRSNGISNAKGQENNPDARGSRNSANNQEPSGAQSAVLRGGVLDTLAAALRGNGRTDTAAPWDPQASPFGDRVKAFQAKVDARDQDRVIGRVENSARAAVDALDGFRNTEGAAIMNRIQTAARADPGGMTAVLSEMKQGGRFGDLRQAFDKALIDDKGFAQAYDKAASALARYGEGREKVEQIIAKRPDAANLTAKFEELDGKLGDRASSIPSRNDGKNMLDDISKTVAEIIQRATDTIRAAFSRAPAAGASPAPAA